MSFEKGFSACVVIFLYFFFFIYCILVVCLYNVNQLHLMENKVGGGWISNFITASLAQQQFAYGHQLKLAVFWIYSIISQLYVVLCTIQYHVYNLKNVKNTHGGVLLSVKFSNTPPWVFFTFFKLYQWYQIAQSTTYFVAKVLDAPSKSGFHQFLCMIYNSILYQNTSPFHFLF